MAQNDREQQTSKKQTGEALVADAGRERQATAKAEAAEREKSNNPATAKFRQYGTDTPGMHPANLPADRLGGQYPVKGTRLDLEDVTGNPGHRMVNPDAPGNSINPGPNAPPSPKELEALSKLPPTRSINEPVDAEPPARATQFTGAGSGTGGSINEPEGSTIGGNMDAQGQPIVGGPPVSDVAPVLESLDPDSVVLGAADFTVYLTGTGFTASSVIVFADQDEPTTLEPDGRLSTGVDMSVWLGAGVASVVVRNGDLTSNELEFEFLAAAGTRSKTKTKTKRKGR